MNEATSPTAAQAAMRRCRNCGADAEDAYCPNCGQETTLALPTVRSMLRDAAGRYVALDGRMWRTLFAILFRPGVLTREYFAGRRKPYIRPARLFLVLSIALFALLRFEGKAPHFTDENASEAERAETANEIADAHDRFNIGPDLDLHLNADTGSWLDPLRRRIDQFNALTRSGRENQLFAGILRYGPYAAFALLPLFALLFRILYIGGGCAYPLRPRRYAAHVVFGAHNHAFAFLMLMLVVLVPNGAVRFALFTWTIAYLLWSMKAVYGGRWSKVLARAFLASVLYFVCFLLAVVGLVIIAVLLG
jgi:rRNA maturation protein Nop10